MTGSRGNGQLTDAELWVQARCKVRHCIAQMQLDEPYPDEMARRFLGWSQVRFYFAGRAAKDTGLVDPVSVALTDQERQMIGMLLRESAQLRQATKDLFNGPFGDPIAELAAAELQSRPQSERCR